MTTSVNLRTMHRRLNYLPHGGCRAAEATDTYLFWTKPLGSVRRSCPRAVGPPAEARGGGGGTGALVLLADLNSES
jgi:hypothetical protein